MSCWGLYIEGRESIRQLEERTHYQVGQEGKPKGM